MRLLLLPSGSRGLGRLPPEPVPISQKDASRRSAPLQFLLDITFREGLPPDIVLDDTDGALRGVEVAGRSSGGHGALRFVLEGMKDEPGGKRAQLVARSDIAEAHVSLWCADPRVSLLLQVKP